MLIEQFILAGAEQMALALTRGLIDNGETIIVSPIKPGGPLKQDFIDVCLEGRDKQTYQADNQMDCKVTCPIASSKYDALAALKLSRIIKQERIDAIIIVDVLRNGVFYTALAEVIGRVKPFTICWCHSLPSGKAGTFVGWLKRYFQCGLLDTLVCVSAAQQQAIIKAGFDKSRIMLIPNGVDLSQFAGRESHLPLMDRRRDDLALPADKKIIVQVANMVPDKDFETLLKAIRLLRDNRSDFHLVLIGRGVDSKQMRDSVSQLNLTEQITLAGVRDDVPEILTSADMLILSSKQESFGLCVLEGMAAGLPVIVSDLPALAELVEHGKEGFRVPPADSDALAAAIARLLDDASLRKQMGSRGQEKARQFSVSQMVEGFYRLIQQALSKRKQPDADTPY